MPNNVHKPTLQPFPKTPAQALLPCSFFSEASSRPWQGPLLRSVEGAWTHRSHPSCTRQLRLFPRAPISPSLKPPTLCVLLGGVWGTELIWRGPQAPALEGCSRRAWHRGGPERPRHTRPLPRGNKKRLPTNPQPSRAEPGSGPTTPGPLHTVPPLLGAAPLRAQRCGPSSALATPLGAD